jgi:RNA polymerase sigma-70 factor (ECF subfamily)
VLAAAQAGQDWAVAVIYHAYHPPLLRYLRWQEPYAAEDLAGEVWLAVAQHLVGFHGDEGALRAWLFAIARRRLADHRRRAARRKTSPMSIDQLAAIASAVDPADAGIGSMSVERAVARLTSGLPREQAEVVMLRVVGGLSVEETAQVMGKRPGAIRVAQHRALKRLAFTLTPDDVRQVFGV